ncbi:hypothetical protein [Streptomyces parvus]|uniref:hypothetical protein n=1 Tax=Streptomyces parvus TaxID=66428 RepID=UPI00362F2898
MNLSPRRRAALMVPVLPSAADASGATRPLLRSPRSRPPATRTHHLAGNPAAALSSAPASLRPPGLDD